MGIKVPLSGDNANHSRRSLKASAVRPQWRGVLITIGTPKLPDRNVWLCDTDVIFPILDESVKDNLGNERILEGNEFVCRHQILAGD